MEYGDAIVGLETAVNRLIGIPRFLGSTQRSDRKYGAKVIDEAIRQASTFIDYQMKTARFPRDIDPMFCLATYAEFIKTKNYANAEKFAQNWMRNIIEEKQTIFPCRYSLPTAKNS